MIIYRNYLIIVVLFIHCFFYRYIYICSVLYIAHLIFLSFAMKQKTSLLIDIFSDIYSFFSETVYCLSNDTLHLQKIDVLKKYVLNIKNFLIELIIFY